MSVSPPPTQSVAVSESIPVAEAVSFSPVTVTMTITGPADAVSAVISSVHKQTLAFSDSAPAFSYLSTNGTAQATATICSGSGSGSGSSLAPSPVNVSSAHSELAASPLNPASKDPCVICSEPLFSNKEVCRLLFIPQDSAVPNSARSRDPATCGHHFHSDCARCLRHPWVCPLCRAPFTHTQPLQSFSAFDSAAAEAWFAFLDVDADGKLGFAEVKSGLKSQSALEKRQRQIDLHLQQFWRRWDPNDNGFVSFDEFTRPEDGLLQYLLAHFSRFPRPPPPPLTENSIVWFRFWDEDRSGALTKYELARAMMRSFPQLGVDGNSVVMMLQRIWPDFERSGYRVDIKDFSIKGGLGDKIIAQLASMSPSTAVSSSPGVAIAEAKRIS